MPNRAKGRVPRISERRKVPCKFDNPESLTLLDVQCSICMGIFIEPVQLPCNHCVCKVCFERTIDNNTLTCPICRKYVGSWVRQNQKNGLMVNQNLWAHINRRFNEHVAKKICGEDDEIFDSLSEMNSPSPRISEPGLIRQEYEAERKRMELEVSARQQQEALASKKLIESIQQREEEERKKLDAIKKKAEEEDALIAQQIAAELASEEEKGVPNLDQGEQMSSAFVRMLSPQLLSSTECQDQGKGSVETLLLQNSEETCRTDSSSSTDSLRNELHHFRPLDIVPKTPPKKSGGKRNQAPSIRKPVPMMRSLDGWLSEGANTLRPWSQKSDATSTSTSTSGGVLDIPSVSSSSSGTSGDKRPPCEDVGRLKSPKRFRRLSPQKSFKPPVSDEISSDLMDFSWSYKISLLKKNGVVHKSPSSEIDVMGKETAEAATLNGESNHVKSSSGESSHWHDYDIQSAFLPLSLEEVSEQAQAEKKYRQEQADFEFALKLQNELNAIESRNRSYELRSVVSLTPKKSQPKVTPPHTKLRAKPATSSQKERRRQCTLEETLNFSVKMEL